MKTKITTMFALAIAMQAMAQQVPTISNPPNGGQNSGDYWSRAGNLGSGANNQNNLFGTKWNSPIYTVTGNNFNAQSYRMKVNAIFSSSSQYTIGGYGWNQGVNSTGYVLIGTNKTTGSSPYIYNDKGAFSLLHLNGKNGSFVQEGGYRPWMQTGVTLTDNQDLSYMGLRKVGTGFDITETVIGWADNAGSSSGPDCVAFRFFGAGDGVTTINTNLQSVNDLDGLHVAQFAPTGEFGLGNTFGVNTTGTPANLYVRPASLAHYSLSNMRSVWQQFTNRNTTMNSGTGETAADGLRIGIVGNNNASMNGIAAVFNQENTPLLFSVGMSTAAINPNIGQTRERMRIMAVNTPTNLPSGGYGVYNPGNLAANATRVAISHDPTKPITRPLSLLHLGYNTGGVTPFSGGVDGWRPWMDLGMFTSNKTDHVFIGLKPENGTNGYGVNDRMDAVIGWGDNGDTSSIGTLNAPDVMRFIFTAFQGTASNPNYFDSPSSKSTNGLEVMRLYPERDTTPHIGSLTYGRVGIGDFTAQGVNGQPTHKLDVVGNGRFRYLPDSIYIADSTVNKYVMVDSLGVLRWSSTGPFGAACIDTISDKLQENRHVDLNDYNFYFTRNVDTSINNNVGFGWDCGTILKAKVDVLQLGVSGIAGSFYTMQAFSGTGVRGFSAQLGTDTTQFHVGVSGSTSTPSGTTSIGILGSSSGLSNSWAGYFNGDVMAGSTYIPSDSTLKTNIQELHGGLKLISLLKPKTFYLDAQNNPEFNFSNKKQFGFISQEVAENFPSLVKNVPYSVKVDSIGDISLLNKNFVALNYTGIIPINTQAIIELNEKVDKKDLSDATIKTNVQDLTQSLDKVLEMRGVSYDWNHAVHPELSLDSNNHVGFLAQELQQVDNRLTYLADDSLLHVKYEKVVPILAEAIQELNQKVVVRDSIIDSLQNQVTDLNNRLTQLENCLSGILPYLCQLSQSAVQANTPQAQEEVRQSLQVTLSNRTAIVLDQNVPNPFAEQTRINFSIPESVKKAQLHFYDAQGKFLQSVEVTERGMGSLTVFGSDLSSGIYTYTLVADGVVVSTKKMMKE